MFCSLFCRLPVMHFLILLVSAATLASVRALSYNELTNEVAFGWDDDDRFNSASATFGVLKDIKASLSHHKHSIIIIIHVVLAGDRLEVVQLRLRVRRLPPAQPGRGSQVHPRTFQVQGLVQGVSPRADRISHQSSCHFTISISSSSKISIMRRCPLLQTKLKVKRQVFSFWVTVPCEAHVGSCTFDDLCRMIPDVEAMGVGLPPDIRCPFKKVRRQTRNRHGLF